MNGTPFNVTYHTSSLIPLGGICQADYLLINTELSGGRLS